jgi:phage terminase Nu1 subunit (DNA packaging protein)
MRKAKETVSATELAALLGLSAQALAGHASHGVVVRVGRGRYDKDASVTKYCAHLRKSASGRASPTSAHRTRLVAAQADLAETKAAVLRGEYVLATQVREDWSSTLRSVRASLLSITARVSARLPHLTPADFAEIDHEVRDALTETGTKDD